MEFKLKLRTGYYYKIHIFENKKSMWEWSEEGGFGAIVKPYVIVNDVTGEKKKCLGDVFFYKGNMGAGLISHEMLHCALWYDRVVNSSDGNYGFHCNENEERLAYILTELVTKLNRKLWKLGVYK